MAVKEYLIKLEVNDPDILQAIDEDPTRFHKRLQNALDHEWPYARMESVRVVWVVRDTTPGPSSRDTDG